MTQITLPRARTHRSRVSLRPLGHLFMTLVLALEARLERRAQLRHLAQLSDHHLKDLGLSRADVEYWSEPAARSIDQWMR